jgi:hypothetical protein
MPQRAAARQASSQACDAGARQKVDGLDVDKTS